ncbi:curli-like amyloid fiber formation chaperone CsgH [Noviherbaspirillum malthae]|uniref:curli-like amyloid fiber formation chaperone CsgH n=1 Tax=Noviherbaspirillum malthae TaxID=1260987 RepID=UPI00188EE841|nr:curli-like amyloid fiber formation chaperone CsgH [Noviherbaspirillum malthae]
MTMTPDADLQVWLDTHANQGQMRIIPYVKSMKDVLLEFRMQVVQQGRGGSSRVSQQGQVHVPAAQAMPLAQVKVGMTDRESCSVELSLRKDGVDAGVYRFDCQEPGRTH